MSRTSTGFDPSTSSDDDAERLLIRFREGDKAAWETLVGRCYDKVRRVVRRRLEPRMRSLYDSTDIANDVFTSLVEKADRIDFQNLQALEAHLVQAAKRKVIDQWRKQHRHVRDMGRECRFYTGDESHIIEPPASDPTPSQYAQARETKEWILARQSGAGRMVVELRELSYDTSEISSRLGLHVRKVQRLLKEMSDSFYQSSGGCP